MAGLVIDFADAIGRLRWRKGAVWSPATLADLHRELAPALRRFQAARRQAEQGYDPWVRCPFLRVPAPAPADLGKAGALVVLVDAVESYLVWQVASDDGWQAEEFSTLPLHARVVTTPAGWITLAATEPCGRGVEREVEVAPGEVVFLRVVPGAGRWNWDEMRWGIGDQGPRRGHG